MTQAEIRDPFADGWLVRSIVPERYEIRFRPGYALAWLATLERQGAIGNVEGYSVGFVASNRNDSGRSPRVSCERAC